MKRILVVRTDRIGDVVMITPMLRELRKRFPDAFLGTLTQPYTREILLHNPHVDVCLTDDLRKETFWQVTRELRSHRFTHGLLVLPTERAAYQMLLAGIWRRVTVGHRLYAILTFMRGVSRNNYVPLRHEADYCMDLARSIGVTTNDISPELFVTGEEKERAFALLGKQGIKPTERRLVLHTGTQGSSPNWSEQRYLKLLEALISEFPAVKIVLTAREMTGEFRTRAASLGGRRVVDVSGAISSVRELIAIIAVADLVITPSTGPEHLADALDVRCIGLHCHRPMNSVQYWGILNKRSINMEVSADYCDRNCSRDKNSCGIDGGINVDDVVHNAHTLLDS
jgi:heptosyltransferase-2